MALPTILIDSATGSDTAASGAGPGTAIAGSAGVSAGDGLSVVLDGSPDLSGVATDGSHVLYFADATAGNRNFVKITATANSGTPTATVTVANALGFTLTKAWAIGGKRLSLMSTTSAKLIENNSLSGDAMPGWIMQMASGHTETRSTAINPRRSGDQTSGPITVKGIDGAATLPIITFSNNGDSFTIRANYWQFIGFELQNSNGTKTASVAFDFTAGAVGDIILRNVRISNSTNKYWRSMNVGGVADLVVEDCNIGYCADQGIVYSSGNNLSNLRIKNNLIHDCTSHGFNYNSTSSATGIDLLNNIFAYNGGDGIQWGSYTGTSRLQVLISGNVFHGNTSDGIEFPQTNAQYGPFLQLLVENNEFTFNGGYGLNFSGASITDAVLAGAMAVIRNNAFFTNTSGKYQGITVASSINEVTTDPSGGLASATKDYAGVTSGTNFMSSVHKAKGYPTVGPVNVGTNSGSESYVDIGLQHQDAGGAAGMLFIPNLDGV